MNKIHVEYSAIIEAEPALIYAIFVDFEEAHIAILPKPYFEKIVLKEGGLGAGTIYDLHMNIFGAKSQAEMHVSEPNPGRTLLEESQDGRVKTTIEVIPINGSTASHVTIQSDFAQSPGLGGFMEKIFIPFIIRHIYKKELQNLALYVQQNDSPHGKPRSTVVS